MNIITTQGMLAFMQTQGYLIMFVLMVVEGTVITYVSAFMASLGIFNIYIVLGLSILGNIVGDLALYLIGRHWGKKILRKHFYNNLKGEKLKKLENVVRKHPGRTITLIKISPVIPIPGLILIGASEVSLKTFLFYSTVVSLAYSLIFTALGFYSGVAFNSIAKYVGNSDLIIGAAVILGIAIWFIVRYASKEIVKRTENFEK